MRYDEIKAHFEKEFDLVGLIQKNTYMLESKMRNYKPIDIPYDTMVVLGLAYPNRKINHTKTHFVPSIYTFGSDYHEVLKNKMLKVLSSFDISYELRVDNHEIDERLAASLAKLGYMGKNQLIINKDLGTYFFIGLVLLDIKIDQEVILEFDDSCGTCRKCISACPVNALNDNGFEKEKCMSHYNQSKRILSIDEIEKNYLLFGCDICQTVCPKNVNKKNIVHEEFELSGKELVSIDDMFNLSNKEFTKKYKGMSYLWKGKKVLLRNAIMLLYKTKNTNYNDEILKLIDKSDLVWIKDTAIKVINKLKKD